MTGPTSAPGDAPVPGSILLLGGTGEARRLAGHLAEDGLPFLSSLAGRVGTPAIPVGPVRVGGFGGPDGLADYLREQRIGAVIDATHPFASRMTGHAAQACQACGVPVLRLQRPSWQAHPASDDWIWVDDQPAAARAACAAGQRIFLTTGRQTLPEFAAFPELASRPVLARMVEKPTDPMPPSWTILCARGPFTLADEIELMRSHAVDVLVTKDSGGGLTEPKLDAATACGVAVVVIRRPPVPPTMATVSDVEQARCWAREAISGRRNPGAPTPG